MNWLKVRSSFGLEQQRTIPNGIDNLMKFVMDSFTENKIIDIDNQV